VENGKFLFKAVDFRERKDEIWQQVIADGRRHIGLLCKDGATDVQVSALLASCRGCSNATKLLILKLETGKFPNGDLFARFPVQFRARGEEDARLKAA
jgi:hypothetical protein